MGFEKNVPSIYVVVRCVMSFSPSKPVSECVRYDTGCFEKGLNGRRYIAFYGLEIQM
jgi:hypothetical protein